MVDALERIQVLEAERPNLRSIARTMLAEYDAVRSAPAPHIPREELDRLVQSLDVMVPVLTAMNGTAADMGTLMRLSSGTDDKPPYWEGTDNEWDDFTASAPAKLVSQLRVVTGIASEYRWQAKAGRPDEPWKQVLLFKADYAFRRLTGREATNSERLKLADDVFKAVGVPTSARNVIKQLRRSEARARNPESSEPFAPDPDSVDWQ
jgi:hypothetical protein